MVVRVTGRHATDVVSLGQPRAQVREALGDFREFRRTPSGNESDLFAAGAVATYAPDGTLMMVEFTLLPRF